VSERSDRIAATIERELAPAYLLVEDESHLHAGHAGAREGGGHFRVHVVSEQFDGRSRLARHRLLYGALSDELRTEIHALAIHAFTPGEWSVRPGSS